MKIGSHVVLCLIYFSTLTFFPHEQAGAGEPINLTAEEYVLMPGEYLVNVLRNTYNIPDHLIFNEYLNLIKDINPDIRDINNIKDYQTLLIPLNLPPKNKKYRIIIKDKGAVPGTTPKIREQKKLSVPVPESKRMLSLEKVNINRIIQEGLTPLLLESGGILQQEGIHEFPYFEDSQLSLDTSTYPIIQFANNTNVILDYHNRLPVEIKDVIKSNWNNYIIVPYGENRGFESILDQLIKEMNFHKVIKHGDPLVIGQDVLIKIVPDWIIYPDVSSNKVFVINLVHSPAQKTLTPIRNYLREYSVKLVDIDLFEEKGEESSPVKEDTEEETGLSELSTMDFTDKLAFVDGILDLAGQDYLQNMPISVYSRDNTGLALKITIDRTFVKNGKKHLIYLKNKPSKLLGILKKQGFPLLILASDEDAVTTIDKLLDFLNIRYKSPIIRFSASRTYQENKIWVNIPGIFFETAGNKVLLTHHSLNPPLISFLKEKGVEPVIYQ
ncbi:MAG: hypothetical protein GQ554_00845 [Deltaproteobacteria bacterium]|nr:hypothetical protein [Deltaproteobacteria bacterium]